MIAYLKGRVLEKGKEFVILLVGDTGYRLGVPSRLLASLQKGDEAALYTHEVCRDDARELYGFSSMPELEFFWKLTSVSGVGPRMAMHLLSLGSVESIGKAVEKADVEYLAGAQGVGRKTAQRVVLELRGKLTNDEEASGEVSEVVSALENLGYHRARIREIVGTLPQDASTEERIKQALRQLAKSK